MFQTREEVLYAKDSNMQVIQQLRYFERVVGARHRIAIANTYETKTFRQEVLQAYTDYLAIVTETINTRLRLDSLLHKALREIGQH